MRGPAPPHPHTGTNPDNEQETSNEFFLGGVYLGDGDRAKRIWVSNRRGAGLKLGGGSHSRESHLSGLVSKRKQN